MPRSRYIATGSNTTVKSGPGTAYRAIVNGVAGATVYLQDSIGLGVTPNYVTLYTATASNLAVVGPMIAGTSTIDLGGLTFQDGLTVAATSNASFTVVFD